MAKKTAAEYKGLLGVPPQNQYPLDFDDYIKWKYGQGIVLAQQESQWGPTPGAYAQGGVLSSGGQMVQPQATHTACMAPMEQPGMWLVENTKRKLIYCNAERGHPGNHRHLMEWQDGKTGPPAQTMTMAPEGFWTEKDIVNHQQADAYIAQKYVQATYEQATYKPLWKQEDIQVSFANPKRSKENEPATRRP